jgi:hypothetical protein
LFDIRNETSTPGNPSQDTRRVGISNYVKFTTLSPSVPSSFKHHIFCVGCSSSDMLAPRRPIVTVETTTSAGATIKTRTFCERADGGLKFDHDNAITAVCTTSCNLTPLRTRKCVVKAPPRVFVPEHAPVRGNAPTIDASCHVSLDSCETSLEVANIVNAFRANPGAFAEKVRDARSNLIGSTLCLPNGMALKTSEGATAFEDAVETLTVQEASARLSFSNAQGSSASLFDLAVQLAAREHASDIGCRGLVTHRGSFADATLTDRLAQYGAAPGKATELISFAVSDPLQIVLQLVVDDGDVRRANRRALLDPNYTSIGVAFTRHESHGAACVIVLASPLAQRDSEGVSENSVAQSATTQQASGAEAMVETNRIAVLRNTTSDLATCPHCLAQVDLRSCVFGPRGRAYHTHCLMCTVCKSTLHDSYFISGSLYGTDTGLARGRKPRPASETSETTIVAPTRAHLQAAGSALVPGQPHCASCFVFRFPPTCHKCGKKTVRLSAAGEAVDSDGRTQVDELSVNEQPCCRECYDVLTTMMTTVS